MLAHEGSELCDGGRRIATECVSQRQSFFDEGPKFEDLGSERLPVFAVFGGTYRYLVWLRRPPTAMLSRRGWQAFRARGRRGANAAALPGLVASNLAFQTFIRKRSRARWMAHQLVAWGCLLAGLVTFPLANGNTCSTCLCTTG